jgi:hypothetical protein
MEGSCERKPPHLALRRREMRQHLVVVNASGSVDVSMMRQQFGLLPGAKAAIHKMLQAKMKKPRAFARRGYRGSALKPADSFPSPGAFDISAGAQSWNLKMTIRERNSAVVARATHDAACASTGRSTINHQALPNTSTKRKWPQWKDDLGSGRRRPV